MIFKLAFTNIFVYFKKHITLNLSVSNVNLEMDPWCRGNI